MLLTRFSTGPTKKRTMTVTTKNWGNRLTLSLFLVAEENRFYKLIFHVFIWNPCFILTMRHYHKRLHLFSVNEFSVIPLGSIDEQREPG